MTQVAIIASVAAGLWLGVPSIDRVQAQPQAPAPAGPDIVAHGPPVPPSDNARALCGLFSYTNTSDGVASFGTVRFDGVGRAAIHIKINAVSHNGGRNTIEVQADGPYTFGKDLMGTMTFAFPSLKMAAADFDYVAVVMDGARVQELFAVLREGGINGQLADPKMRLLIGCER